jgi:capsular polysaccharide biosynthesis protein
MDQDPPSIIQTGYTDGAPVSPRTKRTTVIGLLIGFLAAAAFIVILYLLNDTIKTPEDIQEKLGLNVLASLPLESSDIKNNRNNKKQQTSGHRHVRRKAS